MGTVSIPLTQDKYAVVDEADAPRVLAFRWQVARRWEGQRERIYAQAFVNGHMEFLHRFVMEAAPGTRIDHWDGDGLNCRRQNLRWVTPTQNNANALRRSTNLSGFKGVFQAKNPNRWVSRIQSEQKVKHLGTFGSPEEAARAYDDAAREIWGEFACLNFPRDGERSALS